MVARYQLASALHVVPARPCEPTARWRCRSPRLRRSTRRPTRRSARLPPRVTAPRCRCRSSLARASSAMVATRRWSTPTVPTRSPTSPYFNARGIAFLEQGGVLAYAHVRGGGEYGKRWWKAGPEDLQAQYLARPDRLLRGAGQGRLDKPEAADDPGRLRRWHHGRPRVDRAPRPVRCRDLERRRLATRCGPSSRKTVRPTSMSSAP